MTGQTNEYPPMVEPLGRLSNFDSKQARIIDLRRFDGLSVDETPEVVGISPRTVKRDWAVAKAWLATQLAQESPG